MPPDGLADFLKELDREFPPPAKRLNISFLIKQLRI